MQRRRDPVVYLYEPAQCPFTATWKVIGGKWKGVIWWRLSNGVGRFGELRRAIPQITKKMLVQQLREMERDGLVRREVHEGRVRRVVYSLTPYGESLDGVIGSICGWGAAHLERHGVGTDRRPVRA
jgi:DNA-binding HxlR family transcriptional regulator